MPDYTGIRDAVASLVSLLRAHITLTAEPGIAGVPVEIGSPREIELRNISNAVSVWLHRVDLQPDLLNRPPRRPDPDHEAHRPTPVELALHVTPMHGDAGVRLLLLGRVLQVFADHRRLAGADLAGALAGSGTTLLLATELPGSYELNLLWGGQQTHLRAGVSLRVTGLVIETHLPVQASPAVLFAAASADQILEAHA